MRPPLLPTLLVAVILCGKSTQTDDRRVLEPLIELIELDYEDQCEARAEASWDALIGASGAFHRKLERDKAFGIFSRSQTLDIRNAAASHSLRQDDMLKRKIDLLLQPGDTILDTEQWIQLVTYGDTALHNIRSATDYDCGAGANCSHREFLGVLETEQDQEILRRMKKSWEKKLPSLKEYLEQVLPLMRVAAKEYNFTSVEDYWDSLGEYEGGLLKARELWDQIKPLYTKLQHYISLRLRGEESVGKPIPVYLFKSLTGEDWSNILESVLPKHHDIYKKLHANIQLKNYGGKEGFRIAAKLIEELNFGSLESNFWSESVFNGTCPTVLIDSCKPNKVKVYTCKDVSVAHYIDAHDSAMRVKYKEIVALHKNSTYILREANVFSALYEAIPGFISLLSLTPHALSRAGLYPLERFTYADNANHNRLILQLIIALRDLPRLNYYLAADEWRLKVLTETASRAKNLTTWSEFRKKFSLIESPDTDILGDPYILSNKPFIGKFMGLILKYQIYCSFADELMTDDGDLLDYVSNNNNRVIDTMSKGYSDLWPDMVSDLLSRRELGVESTGLTDFFKLLDDYLDSQLDPTSESMNINYEEPPEEMPIENEIPEFGSDVLSEVELEPHLDIKENIVDIGDETRLKQYAETSTVGVLEIKNPVAAKDDGSDATPTEASYHTYWWIGVAAVVLIVILLIALIARKRQSHRKQLERQRSENNQA